MTFLIGLTKNIWVVVFVLKDSLGRSRLILISGTYETVEADSGLKKLQCYTKYVTLISHILLSHLGPFDLFEE